MTMTRRSPAPAAMEPDDVREMTGVGREGGQYFSRNGVYLYDRTNKGLDPSVFDAGRSTSAWGRGPRS